MVSKKSEYPALYNLWADSETEVDLLGFRHLVDAVEGLVRSEQLLPATIGVFGDWGSGKSSVLKMASRRLGSDDETLVLWFNGWLFEGYDQAKASLMERLVSQLVEKRSNSVKVKKLAVRLFRRIDWLRVAGATVKAGGAFAFGGPPLAAVVAMPDLQALAKSASEALDGIDEHKLDDFLAQSQETNFNRNVVGFRDDFKLLLKEADVKRMVVIIDDLDRCLPSTIIQTLEAIKLFLSVGEVAFVIGADERLVQYAVRERFPELPGERADVGRDYLEKLIQYPVRIPSLSRSEVQSYISLLFVQAEGDEGMTKKSIEWMDAPERCATGDPFGHEALHALGFEIPDKLVEGLTLTAQIGPLLARGLNGNPRQCKRFLNMLMMRLGMAESRGVGLKRRVLAKLMILEYLKPDLFRILGEMQSEGHGRPEAILDWQARNKAASVDGKPGTREIEGPEGRSDQKLDLWLRDSVALEWLNMEPAFDDTDLGPYFFFSRDILIDHGQQAQRLSPAARGALRGLLSQSEAVQNNAIEHLPRLSSSDASAVLAKLVDRARGEERPETLSLILKACGSRKDLTTDVITCFSAWPHGRLPLWLPPRLHEVVRGSDMVGAVRPLFHEWSKSTNAKLAQVAETELQRIKGNPQ